MSTKTADLMKLDLYKIIGVPNDATDKEVCLINFQKKLMENSGKMMQWNVVLKHLLWAILGVLGFNKCVGNHYQI